MRSHLFLALLLIVPFHGSFGQQVPPMANELNKELDQAIGTILEHHVLCPAPQELAAHAARALNPSISPSEVREAWKLQTPEEISTYLNDLTVDQPRRFRSMSADSSTLGIFAAQLPETQLVRGENLAALGRTYVGLGIRLGSSGGFPMVMSPEPSGPGYAAGLRHHDMIVQIDGVSVERQFGDSVIKRLRDKHGTEVTLRVRRYDQKASKQVEKDITIIRDVINFQRPATAQITEEGFSWRKISLSEINDSTFEELREIDRALDAVAIKSIHIDLTAVRYCSPQQAILLADLLTPMPGQDLGRAVTLKGERQLRATGNAVFSDKMVTLKVGPNSASALAWVDEVTQTRKSNFRHAGARPWVGTEVMPLESTHWALRLPTTQFFAPADDGSTRTRSISYPEAVVFHHGQKTVQTQLPPGTRAGQKPGQKTYRYAEPQGKPTSGEAIKALENFKNGVVTGTNTEVEGGNVRSYNYRDFNQLLSDLPLDERIDFYAEQIDEAGRVRPASSGLKQAQP